MDASILFQIILGWPSIIASLLLMIAGIALKQDKLHLAGALLSTGFCWYLTGGNPWVFGPLIYTLNWSSYYQLRKKARRLSALLITPFGLIAVYFAIAVLTQ